jgi:ArsR family transcriptional regulator
MILCQLADGERSVGDIQSLVGLSQSALSQHLAVLREEGIVATRREGQSIWYRIDDPAAVKVVATLAEIFCPPDVRNFHDRPPEPPETR